MNVLPAEYKAAAPEFVVSGRKTAAIFVCRFPDLPPLKSHRAAYAPPESLITNVGGDAKAFH